MGQKEQTTAIDISAIKTLPDIIGSASAKKIIYVGEYHDRHAHHDVQLQVIKGLHKRNKSIAIGMEMFEVPSQKVLDDYLADNITEREFLKKSEYFKRWSFDYSLYKPIIDFAKAQKIPVIALNIRREIVEKVSKGGLESLSEEDRKDIPLQMDFSNNEYREKIREVFQKHSNANNKSFDFFYQSQILWDETMSRSVDEYFRSNPDFAKDGQMVVLAGGGHLSFGDGIPKRTFRRNGYDYAIILNDAEIEKGIADYIVLPPSIEGAKSPKLMAVLKEADGKVSIVDLPEDSVSKKAGLKTGDIILSLDGLPVSSIDDVRIHLFYKKKEETLKVRVIRKRFLLGDTEKEFDVLL